VCQPSETTRVEIHEYWPSDLQRLFREAGMPRREPPFLPDCGEATPNTTGFEADAPQIVSPLRAVTYTLRLSKPENIALRANRASGAGKVFWFADRGFVAAAQAGEAVSWMPEHAGRYILRAVDETGRADSREIEIEFVP
jgi:penicillin-binding protein 1C